MDNTNTVWRSHFIKCKKAAETKTGRCQQNNKKVSLEGILGKDYALRHPDINNVSIYHYVTLSE